MVQRVLCCLQSVLDCNLGFIRARTSLQLKTGIFFGLVLCRGNAAQWRRTSTIGDCCRRLLPRPLDFLARRFYRRDSRSELLEIYVVRNDSLIPHVKATGRTLVVDTANACA